MEDREAIEMMTRCMEAIRGQRRHIQAIEPQAEAFRVISKIVGLIPGPSQGYGEDLAWMLEKRIKELKANEADGNIKCEPEG
jgi:hypothetical protein